MCWGVAGWMPWIASRSIGSCRRSCPNTHGSRLCGPGGAHRLTHHAEPDETDGGDGAELLMHVPVQPLSDPSDVCQIARGGTT